MKIYILRHGETNFNAEGRFQGQINTELNENGKKQAAQTKKNLENIKFNVIISSPLNRAFETVKIVTGEEPILDNRIMERSFGKLEGEYGIPDYEKKIEEYNVETYESLCERVYSFLNDILEKYKDKQNILVGTHECIAQIIETYFNKNQNKENWKEFRIKNADYKVYEIGEV